MNEWLELVSWVGWSSLETKDSLDRFFSQSWESEPGGDVRELLVLSPLHIVLGALVVVVVISGWLVSQGLLKLQLHRVGLSSWLSPSVVVLEEHVVQVQVVSESQSGLVHVRRDVAYLINHTWSHLSDVHVDQKTVVSVDFKQLVFGQVFRLEVVLDIAMLVR